MKLLAVLIFTAMSGQDIQTSEMVYYAPEYIETVAECMDYFDGVSKGTIEILRNVHDLKDYTFGVEIECAEI